MAHFQLEDGGAPPIFIMSHERSGSTLLRIVVDTHSKICSPAELALAQATDNLTFVIDNSIGLAIPELKGEEGAPARAIEVRRALNGVMQAYSRAKGKSHWCEKWPRTARSMNNLKRVFPDAKFVLLYRDCLDTAASCLDAYGRYGFPQSLQPYVAGQADNFALAMVTSWVDETTRLLALEKESKSSFRIRYEDVVREPEKALPPLFEFIGVEWEPDIVKKVFKTSHDGLGTGGDKSAAYKRTFDLASIGKGASTIPLGRLTKPIIERANELQKQLDYPEIAGRRIFVPVGNVGPRSVVQEAVDVLVTQVFTLRVPENLRANASGLAGRSGAVHFIIVDGQPRDWYVSFEGAEAKVGQEAVSPLNGTVTLDQGMLCEIAAGRTNFLAARRDGLVGYDGEELLLGQLGYFFIGQPS